MRQKLYYYKKGDFKVITDNKKFVKIICPYHFKKKVEYPEIILNETFQKNGYYTLKTKRLFKAVAKCHPDDEFNLEKGINIALNRVLQKMAFFNGKITKQINKRWKMYNKRFETLPKTIIKNIKKQIKEE